MKSKSFIGLAVVTIVVVAAAALVLQMRERETSGAASNQLLYPGLLDRINDIGRVTLTTADGNITMMRSDRGWGLVERSGYPVAVEQVRTTLVTLAEMRLIEAQTRKPERYQRLSVEGPDKEDSESILLVAEDKSGGKLASLIVGRKLDEKQGGGVFVRRSDEAQAWLARGQFKLWPDPIDWLEREVTDIAEARIRRVLINHPDGHQALIEKAEPTEKVFTVKDVPAGKKAKSEYDIALVASPLDFLTLDDVSPADQVPFPGNGVTTEFVTFDGLKVVVQLGDKGEEVWATVRADTTEPHPSTAALREKAEEESDTGRIAKQLKSADEVAKEAAAINARAGNWVYRFTDYKIGKFKSRITDLTEDVKDADKKKDSGKSG